MQINNKISPFLTGPYIFFGLIFVPGVITGISEKHWGSFIFFSLVIWYLFGTFSGLEIDTVLRKFRAYNKHFGVFKTGRWRSVDDYIGVTLVPMKRVYTLHSRSNRTNSSYKNEYRIYLVNKNKKPAVQLKTCKTPDEGQNSLDEFAIWLHLPVFSIKH